MSINPEDSSLLFKGALNDVKNLSMFEKKNKKTKSIPHSLNKPSIFRQKPSRSKFIIIFVISIIFTICCLVLYTTFSFIIEKIETKLTDGDIIHTKLDNNIYEIIKLRNEIEVTLISNANSSINGLGITIGTGNSKEGVNGLGNLITHIIDRNLTMMTSSPFTKALTPYMLNFFSKFSENFISFSYELEKTGFTNSLKLFSEFLKNFKVWDEAWIIPKKIFKYNLKKIKKIEM